MRVLLVSHETSRTGAPRVAVMAVRTLAASGHAVRVVARAPGPLLPELAAEASTTVEPLGRVRRRLWTWGPTRALALALDTAVATALLLRDRPDLLYLNSASSAVYLRPARWLGISTLLHVHESGAVAGTFLAANRAPRDLSGVTLVACSPSVQGELASLTGTAPGLITMVPSVPDGETVDRRADEPPGHELEEVRLTVGSCGTAEARKGADLWVEVARLVRRAAPELDVRFAWVGDVAEAVPVPAGDDVSFLGPRSNPYPYLRRFDVLTLTSRDDPFPLVVLEAMHLGTPVVAFDVGAVALQVGDAGVLVPAGDVQAFASELVALLRDDERRRELGLRSRRRVEEHYSASTFSAALERLVGAPSGTA